MTYVIGESCIGVKDRSCVDACPADCIHESGRSLQAMRVLFVGLSWVVTV